MQVVCTPYTAIVEEYALFLKARQLVVQALPCGSAIVGSRLPSPCKSARDLYSESRRSPTGRHSAHEHSIDTDEDGGGVDAATRLAALQLPASWLHAWLRHTEALAEGDDADADGVATWLKSSEKAWLSVQPALEYASFSYGPVHAVSWLQWEEVKALHSAEQPRCKWHAESAGKTVRRLPVRTPPCIVVQVVLLWFHEGQMHRLMPEEFVNLEAEALAARSMRPPRAAFTGQSVAPLSRSLFTCYMTLEYPPGTLCPHRVPVPIAEPLLTRQELVELVRSTAHIRRHHPLRVAYRVWPQATSPTAAAPASALPWSGGRAGVSSAAARIAVATPTMRAPPLHALESDAAMVEFIRDVLAYGHTAVQVVAVRSGRVPVQDMNGRRPEAVSSGVRRAPQRPYYTEPNMQQVEERRTVLVTNNARTGDVHRGITRKYSTTQHGSLSSVWRMARVASPPPMAAAAEEQSSWRTVEPLPIDREDEEVERENSKAPAEAGGTTALAVDVSSTGCLGSCGDAAPSPSPHSHDLQTRGPPSSIHDSDAMASGEDDPPHLLLQDAVPPSLSEGSRGSITPAGEAALQGIHHAHFGDADEFGATWRDADRYTEYRSARGAGDGVDLQQQPELQHEALRRPRMDRSVQCKLFVEDARKRKLSAQYPETLMAVDSWSDHRASRTPHVCSPTPSPRKPPADPGDVSAGAAEGATTDNAHVAVPAPCAKSPCSVSVTQQRRTTSGSCGSATIPDPATMVLVRYEVSPTVVCVSGPVQQTVLQHLQEAIFQRCCAHLCHDLGAPRPRFHAAHHHRHAGSAQPTKAAASFINSSSAAAAPSTETAMAVRLGNGDRHTRDSGLPITSTTDVPRTEFILPLHHYTFTRVEEDALERCIAEVMGAYQGLEQLPAKEAEEWIRATPNLVSPGCEKGQEVGNSMVVPLLS